MAAALVEGGERVVEIGAARLPRQRVEMQRHRYQHALAEMPDRRHEDRTARQPGVKLGLRHVLVLEPEAVELEGRAAVPVMRLDQPPAASGIAADRVDRDRIIARDEAGFDQRAQEPDRAGGIAPGVADLGGSGDAFGLARHHLGKSVGPLRVYPMRGAGVEQLGHVRPEPVGQRHRLARRLVRQAQDDEIDLGHHVAARRDILPLRRREAAQRDLRQRLEPRGDAKAGRAGLAVDEHAGLVRCHPTLLQQEDLTGNKKT